MSSSNWYIAEIVIGYRTQGGDRDLVHVNTLLIAADCDEEAYEKSVLLGKAQERTYLNTDGRTVRVSFLGLRNLFYIYDGLEDGSELIYEEVGELTSDEVSGLVRPKEQLAVFRDDERPKEQSK